MKHPNFSEEKKLWKKGFKYVVGLDEAGRGPIAGPVTAAAVTIRPAKLKNQKSKLQFKVQNLKINDSKKLSAKQRDYFYEILTKHKGIKWGIGVVSEKIIDKINIKNAAELAMERAVANLEKKLLNNISHGRGKCCSVDFLLIDGNHLKNLKLKTINPASPSGGYKLIVKADEKVFSCSAASILAKVWRDRIMARYHKKYPKYGFNKHKGYPTKFHRKKLSALGPCVIHRRTFLTKKRVLK